jgi:hypothetical protein
MLLKNTEFHGKQWLLLCNRTVLYEQSEFEPEQIIPVRFEHIDERNEGLTRFKNEWMQLRNGYPIIK